MNSIANEECLELAGAPFQEFVSNEECVELAGDPFQELIRNKRIVSLSLTALMFVGYFGYISSVAFQKEWLSQKISMHITLGLPLGIGVIAITWLLTGFYIWWANTIYDKNAEKIKARLRR